MDHIPLEPGRKKNPRNEAETKAKVNFPRSNIMHI